MSKPETAKEATERDVAIRYATEQDAYKAGENERKEPSREAFEKWWKSQDYSTSQFYKDGMWLAWQARLQAARREERKRTLEVVTALRKLMNAVQLELSGPVKNVPKSTWAAQWDKADKLLSVLDKEKAE